MFPLSGNLSCSQQLFDGHILDVESKVPRTGKLQPLLGAKAFDAFHTNGDYSIALPQLRIIDPAPVVLVNQRNQVRAAHPGIAV